MVKPVACWLLLAVAALDGAAGLSSEGFLQPDASGKPHHNKRPAGPNPYANLTWDDMWNTFKGLKSGMGAVHAEITALKMGDRYPGVAPHKRQAPVNSIKDALFHPDAAYSAYTKVKAELDKEKK
mmetsp:Transcript_96711/g.273904  ORF Transcript_96711/g.273904 Transcript_96711/m.273904 type:complete len:125 (+) Transcript_96711:64-438(+)